MSRSLFPKHQETPCTVRIRVVQSTSEHATVQTMDVPGEHSRLVTSRLPTRWAIGAEVTMIFTPMELEWIQGRRELGSEP